MKLKYPHGLVALKAEVKSLGYHDRLKLRKDGRHRQLKKKNGEILNYWESTGTISFQRCTNGPLREYFTAKYRADGKATSRAVFHAKTIQSDAPVDYLPMDPREHLTRALFPDPHQNALLMHLNKRQRHIDDIFASMPHEAAAGELMFAAVRHAQKAMPEADVHAALCAIACAVMTSGSGLGLYTRIDDILHGTPDEEL